MLDATELAQIARLKGDIAAIQARVVLIEQKKGLNGMQMPSETTADKLACAGYRLEDVDLMPITDASGLLIGYTATRVLTVVEIDCEKGDHISFSNLYDAILNKDADDKLLAPSLLTPASGAGEIPSTAIYAAAFSETGLQKLLPLATSEIGSAISIPLRWIDIPEKTKPKASPLDIAFEEVIEFERRVETGSTKQLVDDYKHTLETFQHTYEEASEKEKVLWKKAKTHVDNELKGLEKRYESFNQLLQSTGTASGTYFVTTWEDEKYAYTRVEYYTGQSQNLSYDPTRTPNGGQNQKAGLTVHYFSLNEQGVYLSKGKEANFKGFAITCYDVLKSKIDAGSARAFHVNPVEDSNINYEYLNRTHDGVGPWWVTLKKPLNQPLADDIEVPDWEDGAIVEMMAEYKKRCEEGMYPQEASDRKKAMLEEIQQHQGELIQQLESLHKSIEEPEETAILLEIWKKKMESWVETTKSLGEDCTKKIPIISINSGFDTIAQIYEDLCSQGLLPDRLKNELIKNMESDIKRQIEENEHHKRDLVSQQPYKGTPTGDQQIANLEAEIYTTEERIKVQTERLKQLKENNCNPAIPINVFFVGDSNEMLNSPDLSVQISAMLRFPDLGMVITATTSGSSSIPMDNESPYQVINYSKYGILYSLTRTPNNYGTYRNLMELRAAAIKKLFIAAGIPESRIRVVAGGNLGGGEENRRVTVQYE